MTSCGRTPVSYTHLDVYKRQGKYTGTRLNRELYELLRHKYPDESIICYSGEPYEIYEACLLYTSTPHARKRP